MLFLSGLAILAAAEVFGLGLIASFLRHPVVVGGGLLGCPAGAALAAGAPAFAHAAKPLACPAWAAFVAGAPAVFAHAGQHLAAAEIFDLGLNAACLRHPGAAAARGCFSDRLAGAELAAGSPLALAWSAEVLPAFLAEQVRTLFALSAVEYARGLSDPSADNGIAACAAPAVFRAGDIFLPNTGAGR